MKWGRHGRENLEKGIERFMSRVAKEESGCWRWIGALGSHKRYGSVGLNGRSWLAHRLAWFLFKGEDPGAMCVCHTCDNGLCVNPEHLFLGTQKDNVLDMEQKKRAKHPSGSSHAMAKLTDEQVARIRLATGTTASIARQYGVTPPTIKRIRNGTGWVTK